MEPEGPLLCSQKPSTGPYPNPDKSSPYHPILKSILILVLSSNLCLGLPNGFFGCAIAQAVSRWLPTAAIRGSKPDLGMWDLWWDKVALGQVFSEFLGFPCNRRSLHQLLHNHPHVSSGENVQ
jgi:hypothetical protein